MRFRVREDGTTDEVQILGSSGYDRIDQAAVAIVRRRWKCAPGTVDGKVSEFWFASRVVFQLWDTLPSKDYVPPFYCCARPFFSVYDQNIRTKDGKLLSGQWWLSLNDNSRVTDALLQTSKCWRRLSKDTVTQSFGTSSAPALLPANAHILRRTPSVPCWINVPG